MAILLKSNANFAGDPASLPPPHAPLPLGAQYYVDFVDPVSAVNGRAHSRLASNAVSFSADAAILRTKGGGYKRVEANALDRFRYSIDGTKNLGLSLAHNLDRQTVKWDGLALTTNAAAIAVAEAGDTNNTWYSLTADGTEAVHQLSIAYSAPATGPRMVAVEVARPVSNAAPYMRLRLAGTALFGVFDITAGVCRGSGGAEVAMYRTARGYLITMYVASAGKDGSVDMSVVGDYEGATASNSETLSTAVMFRAWKVQGYSNTSTQVPLADWLPASGTVTSAAPTVKLLSTTLATNQPFTLLARLRTNASPYTQLAGLGAVGGISARWGTSDPGLFILSGSTVLTILDVPYAPDTDLHLMHRYDGANLTIGVATGAVGAATEFKTFTTARTIAAGASISYGDNSNPFGGTLQKMVGWQASRTNGEVLSFMRQLAY